MLLPRPDAGHPTAKGQGGPAEEKGNALASNRSQGRRLLLAALTAALVAGLTLPGSFGAVAAQGPPPLHNYRIDGIGTREQRSAIERTGASIEFVGTNFVLIRGTDRNVAAVRRLGFRASPFVEPNDFPPGDSQYHNYAEMVQDVTGEVTAHPTLIKEFSIGKSYEGRDIIAALITKGADTYTSGRPEVLYDGLHHAREHLTVEETLAIMHLFVDKYASTTKVRKLVNTRAIWIIFDVNPDGGEYDVSGGSYHFWRKNRQPNQVATSARTSTATTPTGGGAAAARAETERTRPTAGASAFSAPETQAIRDFVDSRVIGGRQRITASISFHTYQELVLWPYGYTFTDVPGDMTQADHDVFVALGQHIASTTCRAGDCYTPEQSSDLYITDGSSHRLAVRGPQDLRLHDRDVPEERPARLLPARRGHQGADAASEERGPVPGQERGLPVQGDRAELLSWQRARRRRGAHPGGAAARLLVRAVPVRRRLRRG